MFSEMIGPTAAPRGSWFEMPGARLLAVVACWSLGQRVLIWVLPYRVQDGAQWALVLSWLGGLWWAVAVVEIVGLEAWAKATVDPDAKRWRRALLALSVALVAWSAVVAAFGTGSMTGGGRDGLAVVLAVVSWVAFTAREPHLPVWVRWVGGALIAGCGVVGAVAARSSAEGAAPAAGQLAALLQWPGALLVWSATCRACRLETVGTQGPADGAPVGAVRRAWVAAVPGLGVVGGLWWVGLALSPSHPLYLVAAVGFLVTGLTAVGALVWLVVGLSDRTASSASGPPG